MNKPGYQPKSQSKDPVLPTGSSAISGIMSVQDYEQRLCRILSGTLMSAQEFAQHLQRVFSCTNAEKKVERDAMKIDVNTTVTTVKRHRMLLSQQQVLHLVGAPSGGRVFVTIPGGGDWSNTDLSIETSPLVVEWETTEEKS